MNRTSKNSSARSNGSSQVAAFLNPTASAAKLTRNHMAANRQSLREMQDAAAAKKEAAAEAEFAKESSAARSRAAFAHVDSKIALSGLGRVASDAQPGASLVPLASSGRGVNRHSFLRKKEAPAEAPLPAAFVRPPVAERKATLPPRLHVIPPALPRPERDYIASNAIDAVTSSPGKRRPSVDPMAPAPKPAEYGTVPAYLKERKSNWAAAAEERARAEAAAALCPPGHRLLPDEERIETLQLLKASAAETADLLSKMPLRVELPSAVRRLAELEEKLKKAEKAIALFSKPTVYVRE